ncbi:hypothetical protein T439DRAFT_320134 [Meredithblackwellia eburnea MCA 4105]
MARPTRIVISSFQGTGWPSLRLRSFSSISHISRSSNSTPHRRSTQRAAPPAPPRSYKYIVDIHGYLYLSSTKIRNFTSAYKDTQFLDFFYKRLRPNTPTSESNSTGVSNEEAERFRGEGYTYVSPCGKEINYIKPEDTPLVFLKLTDRGLTYGGTLVEPFQPSKLLVDPNTGYLYHPSPPPRSSRSTSTGTRSHSESPYGPYSLLRSALVLEHFSKSLEWNETGASFEWDGRRWEIGTLRETDVLRAKLRSRNRARYRPAQLFRNPAWHPTGAQAVSTNGLPLWNS